MYVIIEVPGCLRLTPSESSSVLRSSGRLSSTGTRANEGDRGRTIIGRRELIFAFCSDLGRFHSFQFVLGTVRAFENVRELQFSFLMFSLVPQLPNQAHPRSHPPLRSAPRPLPAVPALAQAHSLRPDPAPAYLARCPPTTSRLASPPPVRAPYSRARHSPYGDHSPKHAPGPEAKPSSTLRPLNGLRHGGLVEHKVSVWRKTCSD